MPPPGRRPRPDQRAAVGQEARPPRRRQIHRRGPARSDRAHARHLRRSPARPAVRCSSNTSSRTLGSPRTRRPPPGRSRPLERQQHSTYQNAPSSRPGDTTTRDAHHHAGPRRHLRFVEPSAPRAVWAQRRPNGQGRLAADEPDPRSVAADGVGSRPLPRFPRRSPRRAASHLPDPVRPADLVDYSGPVPLRSVTQHPCGAGAVPTSPRTPTPTPRCGRAGPARSVGSSRNEDPRAAEASPARPSRRVVERCRRSTCWRGPRGRPGRRDRAPPAARCGATRRRGDPG